MGIFGAIILSTTGGRRLLYQSQSLPRWPVLGLGDHEGGIRLLFWPMLAGGWLGAGWGLTGAQSSRKPGACPCCRKDGLYSAWPLCRDQVHCSPRSGYGST